MFTIGLNRAVTLLAEKRAGKGGGRFGRAAAKTVLKELGEHPGGGGKIQVLDGKYGPYVSWNKVNATVPKGSGPCNAQHRRGDPPPPGARRQGRRQEARTRRKLPQAASRARRRPAAATNDDE